MEKTKKIVTVMIIVIILVSISSINVIAAEDVKADINGDGKRTAMDLSLMVQHLVKLKTLSEEMQARADLDKDGEVTITDLSMLARLMVGLGDRDLTEEELKEVNGLLKDDIMSYLRIGWTFDAYEDVDLLLLLYLTPEREYFPEIDLYKLYFGDREPAGGELHANSCEFVINLYKKLFNVDITRDWIKQKCKDLLYNDEYDIVIWNTLIPKREKGGIVNDEYDIVIWNTGFRVEVETLSIDTSFVQDGKYYLYIKHNLGNEKIEYTTLLTLQKVDEKYYLVSNKLIGKRGLTTSELAEIKKIIDNSELLKYLPIFNNLDELDISYIVSESKSSRDIYNQFNQAEIEKIWTENGKELAGSGDFGVVYIKDIQDVYKEKFNKYLDENSIRNKLLKMNDSDMAYIEKYDFVLKHANMTRDIVFRIREKYADKDLYYIYLDARDNTYILTLKKIDEKYYFVSFVS